MNPMRTADRPGDSAATAKAYALGYSDGEFKRLEMQAALLSDFTTDVLKRAGLAPGMRVLDVGSGVGDVSLIAADLVGPTGLVVGIDRSPDAVAIAERRAAAAGKRGWMHFTVSELDAFASAEVFDAVIGRLVLMYLPDPAASLRRLAAHVRQGGIVAFHEMAMPMARSVPEGPLYRRSLEWILETFRRAGFEVDMGGKLPSVFADAGLPAPKMVLGGMAGSGVDTPVFGYLVGTLRSLAPMAERLKVFSAEEAGLDTLVERLSAEATGLRACLMPPPLVGAWTTKP